MKRIFIDKESNEKAIDLVNDGLSRVGAVRVVMMGKSKDEIAKMTYAELLKIRQVGRKTADEIADWVGIEKSSRIRFDKMSIRDIQDEIKMLQGEIYKRRRARDIDKTTESAVG